jgi:hypothetical protein
MNWTSYKPLLFEGKSFHQKDIEFIKFIVLKRKLKNISFEIALSKLQHKNWQSSLPDHFADDSNHDFTFSSPSDLLIHYGWMVVDPAEKCGDIDTYRNYILNSKAEWSVAKGGYAVSKAGWFSCRSACYLAAGRPVIVQNTGFEKVLPVGEGILCFDNIHKAKEQVMDVEANYHLHSKRAKEIAVEYFDAAKVLQHLVNRAMTN